MHTPSMFCFTRDLQRKLGVGGALMRLVIQIPQELPVQPQAHHTTDRETRNPRFSPVQLSKAALIGDLLCVIPNASQLLID
jgi:hypothetical protein